MPPLAERTKGSLHSQFPLPAFVVIVPGECFTHIILQGISLIFADGRPEKFLRPGSQSLVRLLIVDAACR